MAAGHVLLVDFNNFSRYPTIAIGYLAAVLRHVGYEVSVYSPFAVGLNGVVREPPETRWSLFTHQARYWSSTLETRALRSLRSKLAFLASSELARSRRRVLADFEAVIAHGVDAVLISTYLMYRPHCEDIAQACSARSIPLLLGSQSFSLRGVANHWSGIEGVTALVGGEVEQYLPELVEATIKGEDLSGFRGVWTKGGGSPAPPLKDLDALPFPDYDDFPWDQYPNRITPMITGRGCGWGKCTFCSDILTGAGRTYRSRSPNNVLEEARYQSDRNQSRLFVFTDLKLNSNPAVWNALASHLDEYVEGAKWIGAVHVSPGDETLSKERLEQVRKSGCVRLTTGLESGSQEVLDGLKKGTDLSRTSRFLFDAASAGISVRTTMIVGAPDETAADIDATRSFLDRHGDSIERVRLNRMSLMTGTPLAKSVSRNPEDFPTIYGLEDDPGQAIVRHLGKQNKEMAYRRAIRSLIRTVHAINRKPLNDRARDFEGVM